jgi:hypothetical protein
MLFVMVIPKLVSRCLSCFSSTLCYQAFCQELYRRVKNAPRGGTLTAAAVITNLR